MRLSIASTAALFLAGAASAASSWAFSDATVQIVSKAAGDAQKHAFTDKDGVGSVLSWRKDDSIKVELTAKEGSKKQRPHQAFVVLKDAGSGLEASFPFAVKESGKGVAQISYKKMPRQFRLTRDRLEASIVLGSFGSTQPSITNNVFQVEFAADADTKLAVYKPQERYGKKEEIHHIFREDAKSPPMAISAIFSLLVMATVPAAVIGWVIMGANVDDMGKALSSAPIAHAAFFGSLVAMEAVFIGYYVSWKLLPTLPVMIVVGGVAFLSGIRALREVQQRRLAAGK